ncbi:unnamed protein product [Choristocarpus tenellus]
MGIGNGGVLGFIEGYQGAANRKPRVLVNSIMNACGKRGSRLGNALGVLGMMCTSFEAVFDHMEIDQYLGGYQYTNPFLATLSTGILYKSTAGPRVALMAGALGAALAGVGFVGSSATSVIFGRGQRGYSSY